MGVGEIEIPLNPPDGDGMAPGGCHMNVSARPESGGFRHPPLKSGRAQIITREPVPDGSFKNFKLSARQPRKNSGSTPVITVPTLFTLPPQDRVQERPTALYDALGEPVPGGHEHSRPHRGGRGAQKGSQLTGGRHQFGHLTAPSRAGRRQQNRTAEQG
ncbi:hypothetical protein GCM10010372_37250 [Streptomyces tauricus]|nr:hypothetical protein GCM10010372_37250 [Streptomyces tauricus]